MYMTAKQAVPDEEREEAEWIRAELEKAVEGFVQDANGKGRDRLTNSQVIIVRAIAKRNPGADVHTMIDAIGRALPGTDPTEIYAKSIKAGILPPISETTGRRLNDLAALWKYTIESYFDGKPRPTIDDILDEEKAEELRGNLLDEVRLFTRLTNAVGRQGSMIPIPKCFDRYGAVALIRYTGDVASVKPLDRKDDPDNVYYYHHTGPQVGIWTSDTTGHGVTKQIAMHLGMIPNDYDKIYKAIEPAIRKNVIQEHTNINLVPCNNGIVDISNVKPVYGPIDPALTGFEFTPYLLDNGTENPEYVRKYREKGIHFLYKWDTDFNPSRTVQPVLTGYDADPPVADENKWGPEDHMKQALAGNENAVRLIWELFNFALRGVSGGYGFWFIDGSRNSKGGGAKSTTALMLVHTMGEELNFPESMEGMGEKFGLEGLLGKKAVISTESDASHQKIEKTAVLKKAQRGEKLRYEEKFKGKRYINFTGPMIQCFNGKPRVVEKNDAFSRKLAIVQFPQVFDDKSQAIKRDYIVDQFIRRRDVREYVLLRALSLGPIKQYTPAGLVESEEYMAQVRAASSTVFAFMEELTQDGINGSRIPTAVLWTIYRDYWTRENNYNPCNRETFKQDLEAWAAYTGIWRVDQGMNRILKNAPEEPFLKKYPVRDWTDESNTGAWSSKARANAIRGFLIRVSDTARPAAAYTEEEMRMYEFYRLACSYCNNTQDAASPGRMRYIPTIEEWAKIGKPMPQVSGFITTDTLRDAAETEDAEKVSQKRF